MLRQPLQVVIGLGGHVFLICRSIPYKSNAKTVGYNKFRTYFSYFFFRQENLLLNPNVFWMESRVHVSRISKNMSASVQVAGAEGIVLSSFSRKFVSQISSREL